MKRINNNPVFSGIVRFLDFDIQTGESKVLISNKAYAPFGEIHRISYDYYQKLMCLVEGNSKHGKMMNDRVVIVDRYIIKEIQNIDKTN